MSDTCLNCMGLIMEPGSTYGYSGKICHCPVNPVTLYQRPASKELPKKNIKWYGITYFELYNDAELARWKKDRCSKGWHLFDEVSSEDHYLHCDACELVIPIRD